MDWAALILSSRETREISDHSRVVYSWFSYLKENVDLCYICMYYMCVHIYIYILNTGSGRSRILFFFEVNK